MDEAWGKEALRELRAIAKLGLPLALSAASGTINNLLSSIMLGHLDTLALAATSVSTIWTSLTDVFFLSGFLGYKVREESNKHCDHCGVFFFVAQDRAAVDVLQSSLRGREFASGGHLATDLPRLYHSRRRAIQLHFSSSLLLKLARDLRGCPRPFMLLRFLTEPVLKAFGLRGDVAHLAGVYAVWSQVPAFQL